VTSEGSRAAQARSFLQVLRNAHVQPTLRRTPLVSVVIATYNWSSVLRHAVRSALWQTYPALEVIVVGDACTDDSEAVVRSFGDTRVRWDNRSENSGNQAAPNNRGIELARGEYIAYLGHDDLWLPTHLAQLMATVERTGAGLAVATLVAIGPPGSNVRSLAGHRPDLRHHWWPPSAVVHRRDAVDVVGGWRDFRTIVEPPDIEFVERVIGEFGVAHSLALTACKFPSAWRKDSYRTRRDDEQRRYATRIQRERLFVERELAAYAWLRLKRGPRSFPAMDAVPDEVPPGWYVRQMRRFRGLPEEPEP
jgi:glycosyltransferase involved in cell wall biosynthesis